ncbi:unnamed protein product [Acanthosepion pharaonis]|uniref:Uncharacterized protein n=1 Tax=Acanthosepion pharaonis TaxID=158019 RepID=A0A812D1E3_ACAPH|nr:unnamed protein product [Sepia pharaonis]
MVSIYLSIYLSNLDGVIPFVLLSVRECVAIFTDKSKWDKKSAPRIGVFTFACVKIHGKDLLRPKSSVSDISPYVSICDPFAACNVYVENVDSVRKLSFAICLYSCDNSDDFSGNVAVTVGACDVAYTFLSWLLSCILSAISAIFSSCKSSGSDASICVVCVCSLSIHSFFNTTSDMVLSPNKDRIFLKSCEGFIHPWFTLLNKSCNLLSSDLPTRLIIAAFNVL